jgi:hypothetical protein
LVISDPIIHILDRFTTVTLSSEGLTTAIITGGTISTDEASVPDMSVGFMVGVIGKEGWHRKGFLRYKWATCVMNAHYDSFQWKVLPVLVKNEIGVLGMKPMGSDPMTPSEIEALVARTRQAAERGKFELYKTTDRFNGTYRNLQWLG